MKLTPGDLIDQKYRVLRLLGTGGMGSVYEAENTRVDRRVAIKVMHQVRDQQDVVRFEREARAAQIGSSNIVQVFDLGYLADGSPYMVMEYLAGESLGERLQRLRSMTPAELLPIARQILDALGAAHRAGIIHRDLKPDNVYLVRTDDGDQEIVKLLDFGISKFTDAARKAADVSLTRSGVAVGTPHFMSPEQVQGSKDLDFRTDLFSLGVILYRALSGQLPFQADEVAPLLVQILMETPKPLCEVRPGIDADLSALVARSMARRAEDRFQSAAEFRSAIVVWEQTHSGAVRTIAAAGASSGTPFGDPTPIGTNASWSSTAAEIPDPKRTLRNIGLAVLFSLVGFGGLFFAYGLWSNPAVQTVATGAANSTLPIDTASAPSASATVSPLAVAPAVLQPPELPVHESVGAPSAIEPTRPGAHPLALPAPPPVAPPTPAAVTDKPAVSGDDDPDNRHMSRGVH